MSTPRHFWLLKSLLFMIGVFILSTTLHATSEYKYSYIPKKVYENQVFPVTVICISQCTNEKPEFIFDTSSNIQPLSNIPLSVHNGNDSFYTFYFKAYQNDIRIPSLLISSKKTKLKLEPQNIMMGSLKLREDFCSVLAADMKIASSQVSNYDGVNLLVTLSIEAFEANLEDMKLKNVLESGVEYLKRADAKAHAEFYFVVPASEKQIKFTYFNTIKKQYVYLKAPIELDNTTVTTQTDLNPKEDSFELLKKYTFIFLVGFFLLMFLIKRDFFYLILGVISFITLLTFYIPHEKICIKQGAPLYILPTKTSTVSTKIIEELNTMLLSERGDYKKIEYKKGIIGWVKNEDICEN